MCVLISLMVIQPVIVHSTEPDGLDLWYDYPDQRLYVQIAHSVINPAAHYIAVINVTVNGVHFDTINYTSQEESPGMTDDFPVTAVDGDIIGVHAYCNLEGSIYDEIIVEAVDPGEETTPTNTGTVDLTSTTTNDPSNGLTSELMLVASISTLMVVIVMVIGVRYRR